MFLFHIDVSVSVSVSLSPLPLCLKSINIFLGEDFKKKKKWGRRDLRVCGDRDRSERWPACSVSWSFPLSDVW